MIFIHIVFLLSILISSHNSEIFEESLIREIFEDQNMFLTISMCWTKERVKNFIINNSRSENPKLVVMHSIEYKSYDYIFSTKSHRNWYITSFINCVDFQNVSQYINQHRLFHNPNKHLFIIHQKMYNDVLAKMKSYNIFPMSNVIIASYQNDSSAKLTQPYKIGKEDDLIIEQFGIWTEETGLKQFYKNVPMAMRRKNYQKSAVVVGVVLQDVKNLQIKNFDDIAEYSITSNEPYFSQDFPNIYNLIQYLNASFHIRMFDSYGYLNHSTGEFDGLVRDLLDEKSDIGGTSFITSLDRKEVIEFLKSFNSYGTKFILKKPSMSFIENIFLMTFTKEVWLASLIVLTFFGIVLYGLLNWEARNNLQNKQNMKRKYTTSDIILITLEAVCQQGTFTDSKTYSGRLLILILFTAFMFLYVAYSAYILVLLQSTTEITSIRQLVESRIDCGGLNLSYMMTYYESTKDDALKELYEKKIQGNKHVSLEDGMRRVQDGNFAFQVVLSPAYNYILKMYTNYDICKLQELPGYMNTKMYIAVPKTSQHKKLFKIGLLRVDESGLQLRTKRRLSRKPKCYNEGGNFQSVRIYDCQSVFMLYLVGIILSVIILFTENFLFKYNKRKQVKPLANKFKSKREEDDDIDDILGQLASTYLP